MGKDSLIIADKQKSIAISERQIDRNLPINTNNPLPEFIENLFNIGQGKIIKQRTLPSFRIR